MKAATEIIFRGWGFLLFQSTPPVKAATQIRHESKRAIEISIHAAREGGDDTQDTAMLTAAKISIHAAREGGD